MPKRQFIVIRKNVFIRKKYPIFVIKKMDKLDFNALDIWIDKLTNKY
jgi:hypothetical protein